MGWDFIEYEGHLEQFDDFDLWTLRHFFVTQAQAMETAQPNPELTDLREFFECWDWLGPGVFTGTNFSKCVLKSRSRWELLVQLLQLTGDRISAFGESIPLDYLETHINSRTAYFTQPQPTQRYLLCIGRINTLLSKHEPRPLPKPRHHSMNITSIDLRLPTEDVKLTLDFYADVLYFYRQGDSGTKPLKFGTAGIGNVRLNFSQATAEVVNTYRNRGDILTFWVDDIEAYYAKICATGKLKFDLLDELTVMQPGVWQFTLTDCHGYRIGFAMPVRASKSA